MLNRISKHLKVRQKYSATRRIFNSLVGGWKWGQTRSFLFDILLRVVCNLKNPSLKRERFIARLLFLSYA